MNPEMDGLSSKRSTRPDQKSADLADPHDFEVIEADESATPTMSAPFHGQCGSTKAEYDKLLREGDR
jgi:hypothetical protein